MPGVWAGLDGGTRLCPTCCRLGRLDRGLQDAPSQRWHSGAGRSARAMGSGCPFLLMGCSGFLLAWWLGSKRQEVEAPVFQGLSPDIGTASHLLYSFVKQSQSSPRGRGGRSHPSRGIGTKNLGGHVSKLPQRGTDKINSRGLFQAKLVTASCHS